GGGARGGRSHSYPNKAGRAGGTARTPRGEASGEPRDAGPRPRGGQSGRGGHPPDRGATRPAPGLPPVLYRSTAGRMTRGMSSQFPFISLQPPWTGAVVGRVLPIHFDNRSPPRGDRG